MKTFKKTLEPAELKRHRAYQRKSRLELLKEAKEMGLELSPDLPKRDIIKELLKH